jgi:hypothetical protein
MKRRLTTDDVRAMLAIAVKSEGSQRAFGRKHGFTNAYVSDVILGRRPPADAICKVLGIVRKVSKTYEYEFEARVQSRRT